MSYNLSNRRGRTFRKKHVHNYALRTIFFVSSDIRAKGVCFRTNFERLMPRLDGAVRRLRYICIYLVTAEMLVAQRIFWFIKSRINAARKRRRRTHCFTRPRPFQHTPFGLSRRQGHRTRSDLGDYLRGIARRHMFPYTRSSLFILLSRPNAFDAQGLFYEEV